MSLTSGHKFGVWAFVLLSTMLLRKPVTAENPWIILQDRFKEKSGAQTFHQKALKPDPWVRLRAIYLPFTEDEETAALKDLAAARKVSAYLLKVLKPFANDITAASLRFDIPWEIIGAVIMVESGGNSAAKAKTSSARGLMQTVTGTFREARQGLLSEGIAVAESPYDPHASIMAGSWYLDRMYRHAVMDEKPGVGSRKKIRSWRYPVEYYYAGPGNGRINKEIVVMYAGGRRVVIDKRAYSQKVLKWAKIMNMGGGEEEI